MAKARTATKRPKDRNAELESVGQITVGGCPVQLERRNGARLIIGFHEAPDNGAWLSQSCKAENYSRLGIFAKTPKAFQTAAIKAFLKSFAAHPQNRDQKISLCGTGPSCAAVLAHGQYFQDPILVALDPPPDSTATAALGAKAAACKAGYFFYDPLMTAKPALMEILKGPHIHWLKTFAAQGASINALWRMKIIHSILPAALNNELDPALYYSLLRARKDFYFYRIGIEAALKARGKTSRIAPFRTAFRKRRTEISPAAQFDILKAHAEFNRPDRPGSWLRTGQKGDTAQTWPSAGGNVWMLDTTGGTLRYLSDRWHGVTMGYEERAGVTLAQTPPVAIGFLGFGDGLQVERPLKRRFPWHVTDTRLDGNTPAFGPTAEATLLSERLHAAHQGLFTVLAISQSQAGITAVEATRGAPAYVAALEQVKAGRDALKTWGKSLFIDRVRLNLLTGAPQTSQADAADHYAQVATDIAEDLTLITEQHGTPFVTVVPQAGSRHDGTSEVSLAEGRFDLDNPTLNALVPTPAYPWPLMPGTPSTHSPEAALLMDELCMIAICERQAGRPWHCPALQFATATDQAITAHFSSLNGLEIGDGAHGFHLIGKNESPEITKVEVISDTQIRLHLDAQLMADEVHLAYAWGHRQETADTDQSANHGTLRDHWSQSSAAIPGQTLYRYALPGRVPLKVQK